MKAAQLAPHGRIEVPPIQHLVGGHRMLAATVALAVVAAVAILAASTAFAPGVTVVTGLDPGDGYGVVITGDQGLAAFRKVFDATELAPIVATRALAATGQDEAALDAAVQAIKSPPSALAATRQEDAALDSQLKTKITKTIETPPGPFAGKDLPL